MSIDEFMLQVKRKISTCGKMSKNAIPEQYPLLHTIQLTVQGYYKCLATG